MMNLGKYIKNLRKLIAGAGNILLICHVNPDGDAVGSMLAFYHYLKSTGKSVSMLSPNYLQDFLLWMDGAENINIFLRNRKKAYRLIDEADLIVFIDFNQPSRLAETEKAIGRSNAVKVLIDHHVDPCIDADLIISDTTACATAEIIHEVVAALHGGPFATDQYNEALYVGIITDTGNFEHGSYTGNTMRIVAALLDSGVDKDKVFDRVYNNFSPERMRLQGLALHSRLKIVDGAPAAYIWLTRDDLSGYNYSKGDTEGFVNMPLSIRGISVSALFVEKEGFIKVSLRSKGNFSVNEFAARIFNGGGHMNAAGGEYYEPLEKAILRFETEIKEIFATEREIN